MWVFSLDNVLDVLEDCCTRRNQRKQVRFQIRIHVHQSGEGKRKISTPVYCRSATGEKCPEWLQTLYGQEIEFAENFSLTRNGLDYLIAKVGALLG